jgi:hypothetical protein
VRPLFVIVVLIISTLSVAVFLPTLGLLGNGGAAKWPLQLSGRTVLRSFTPELHPGDRIDVEAMTPDARLKLRMAMFSSGAVPPGSVLRVPIVRNGEHRTVTLHALTYLHGFTPLNGLIFALRTLGFLIFVFVGTALLLLRPSALTATFYCFCIGTYSGAQLESFYTFLPAGMYWYADTVSNVINLTFEYVGFVAFCALFPTSRLSKQRRVALAILLPVLIVSGVYLGAAADDPFFAMSGVFYVVAAYSGACLILGTAFLLATYRSASAADHHRLSLVVAAIIIGLFFSYAANTVLGFLLTIDASVLAAAKALVLLEVIVPLAVAYAVLRHRIIDINFVISKAVVYTALSTIVVGLFALVDLFFSHALSESKAGLLADVALALVLGFFFNSMHQNVDRMVDRLLFRSRHRAEEHLAMVVDAMPYAENERDLEDMLIAEPVRAFGLSFGSLKQNIDGRFDGVYDSGKLIAYLRGRRAPLRLDSLDGAIAVPVFSHGDLAAAAFYGLHRNGSDFDKEELTILSRLAAAAGAAFDRLEAAALRAENEKLRAIVEKTRAQAVVSPTR